MSNEKIAGDPKIISFYYKVSDMFDMAQMWTMYKAINKIDQEGKDLLDSLAITDDEEDFFNSLLNDGASEVFEHFLKYMKTITNAIGLFVSYTPSGGVAADSIYVKIIDHEAYNPNNINAVDRSLEKCIRFYVLKEWFSHKDLDNDAAKAAAKYNQNIRELFKKSFELKKPAITF